MGIWYDQKSDETFPFITSTKAVSCCTAGLTGAPSYPCTLHQYDSKSQTFLLVIDGEIENSTVLKRSYGLSQNEGSETLIDTLYQREGAEGFFKIKGDIAFVLFDDASKTTLLYRAFLKGNPLYFTTKNRRLTVSTNPVFLLYRNDIAGDIDKSEIARLFAVNPLRWKGTVFTEIDEIEPGEVIIHSPDGVKRKKRPLKEIFHNKYDYNDEKTAFETYRNLLEKSVSGMIHPDKKYGIMLSSGMDSSSIAYFAAEKLRTNGKTLTAYSWTLPGDNADESEKIRLLCDVLGIELKLFNGEMYGPFDALDDLFLLPDTPFVNPFWTINRECYRRAGEDGVDYLFNGNYADLLFPPRGRLIHDMIEDRRFDLLFSHLSSLLKEKGLSGISKALLSRLLDRKKKDAPLSMPWMTQEATQLEKGADIAGMEEGFKHYEAALSAFHTSYLGGERYLSGKYGLYRLEPHRDLELIEYSLGFPGYMTYRNGMTKYFARKAMHGLLPDEILRQPRVGILISFALKSFERNRDKVKEKIWDDPSLWNFYIKESWMREKLKEGAKVDNRDLYVIRLCIDLAAWQKAVKPGGELYGC